MMPSLTVRGPAGASVKIVPGVVLNKDGTVAQQSSGGPVSLTYKLRGQGEETWQPRLFYHGSRYMQVEGAVPEGADAPADKAVLVKLQGLFVSGSAPVAGEFSCSNDLFNRTATLINWAIRSNMVSVFTDCPHREKLGWLGQIHLMGPSLMYSHEIPTLLGKMVGDMADAQLNNGLVPSIAPEFTVFGGGFRDSPERGSAILTVPWNLYRWYGDRSILERHYDGMKRYMAYLSAKSKGNIVSHGLGDWYDIGPKNPGYAQLTPVAQAPGVKVIGTENGTLVLEVGPGTYAFECR